METARLDCATIDGYSIFNRVAFFIDKRKTDTEKGEIKKLYTEISEQDQRLEQRAVISSEGNVAYDIPVDLILTSI